jgi:hypothetical protein
MVEFFIKIVPCTGNLLYISDMFPVSVKFWSDIDGCVLPEWPPIINLFVGLWPGYRIFAPENTMTIRIALTAMVINIL